MNSSLPSLLLIEDEISFANVLKRRLEKKGYNVSIAETTDEGLIQAKNFMPQFVILDMKVGLNNGIHILPELRALLPTSKIVLLTGYASIATAVDAIKAGADDYLAKPVDTASLFAVLNDEKLPGDDLPHVSMSPAQMEWEHIQQVLKQNEGNVSATARQLGMHRRTLQRKLLKKPG